VDADYPVADFPWASQPAAKLGWGLLVAIMMAYSVGLDRTFLVDQQSYLNNFIVAPTLDWAHWWHGGDSPVRDLVVGIFSEEILWLVWTTALAFLFSPQTAVVVTVCAVNLLVALSVVRLRDPLLPLVIWLVVPVGFVVTGLLQLRQGLALGVMLYLALRVNRPVLATALAATIHTTFALALPFGVIAWLCGRRHLAAVLIVVIAACTAAYLGGMLFETFGGRRLQTYDVGSTDAISILYVFGSLLCVLPSLHRLLTEESPDEAPVVARSLGSIATMHVGVTAFVVASFFVFPFGAGRVGYLTMLLLIPILPSMRRRDSVSGAVIFSVLVVYLLYLAVKTLLEGTYDILLFG
jgi:hypothetical protein